MTGVVNGGNVQILLLEKHLQGRVLLTYHKLIAFCVEMALCNRVRNSNVIRITSLRSIRSPCVEIKARARGNNYQIKARVNL